MKKWILLALLAAPAVAQDGKDHLVLRGAIVYTVSGEPVPNAAVIIQDGRITDVLPSAKAVKNGGTVIDLPKGSVIVPGFVDLHSHIASIYEANETTESFTPHVKAFDAFSTNDLVLRRSLGSGVTRALIAPGNSNVVSGQPGFVRLNGERLDRIVVEDSLGLKISLTSEALQRDRHPTSAPEAMKMLRGKLKDPTSIEHRLLIKEKKIAFLHARSAADIQKAIKLVKEFDLKGVLVHADEVSRVIDDVSSAGIAVAFGPVTIHSPKEVLETPGKLAAKGIPFGFVTDAPTVDEGHLRVSAALAVKYGLDQDAALKALTYSPARILGSDVGEIKKGAPADLVVLSGAPVSLTSDITLVVSNGRIIYRKGAKE